MPYNVSFTVNGAPVTTTVEADESLAWVLRERLGLLGTKIGCGTGDCGACTVLLDGDPVCSCLLLAVKAQGREVLTIEGLGAPDRLHPLQQAFIEHGALQCGFCGPGMLLSAAALLARTPRPDEQAVREAIAGNLCRCTGYAKIVDAILAASRTVAGRAGLR
ncbi:MAG: (2Fe-2S)-binding protein [Armatimonadota bacterium]|nr:(2Fe-2S)-binding protein [Armatimonadota bacterium]MDR7450629.1 (2Fe-2S)-binding protein [Armatimonadota bacterium]MDR7466238.1 (2Fe-2S)-binding protein [Armatimonadota bacterium]MDR7492959.1 (2Fe-2S)-binding protein [Armatimonadota bacterium]MDR7498284.1 (2Fe-2S)-binding protein [Armatimonadota bacterium]